MAAVPLQPFLEAAARSPRGYCTGFSVIAAGRVRWIITNDVLFLSTTDLFLVQANADVLGWYIEQAGK